MSRPLQSRGARPWVLLAGAGAAAGLAAGSLLSLPNGEAFPHGEHVGLFPACEGCHAGVPEGRADAYYSVTPADCAACHDGTRVERVDWSPPAAPRASNLDFSHPEHAREVAEEAAERLDCADCHREAGAERRMEIAMATPEACLACHAHEAPTHLASGVVCGECHRPLASAEALPAERIAAFPVPPDHEAQDFIWSHGQQAEAEPERCVVCHARESCARCHLNADRLGPVADLPMDRRVAALAAEEPGRWPVPPSHQRPDWLRAHGVRARADVQACANCHAAASCEACHGEARPPVVAQLPRPDPGEPAGVEAGRSEPPGHTPHFLRNHGTAAATALPSCDACHTERECASCHRVASARPSAPSEGWSPARAPALRKEPGAIRLSAFWSAPARPASPRHARPEPPGLAEVAPHPLDGTGVVPDTVDEPSPAQDRTSRPTPLRAPVSGEEAGAARGFHPPNFVLRHGAEAFAARHECAQCHSREAFCRSCHTAVGTGAEGPFITGAFHDGQPEWLLAHGRAARQNMEACASCHQQTSCLRCHSARSGWGMNPHGRGFDPARVGDRSRMSCAVCHFSSQLDPP